MIISPGDGSFSVLDNGSVACSGRIEVVEDLDMLKDEEIPEDTSDDENVIMLKAPEIYRELRLRGYEYAKQFQGLHSAKAGTGRSMALWNENWVTFLDALLQVGQTTRLIDMVYIEVLILYDKYDKLKIKLIFFATSMLYLLTGCPDQRTQ